MKSGQPPYWMNWLLDHLISGSQAEIIKGDLAEIFNEQLNRHGSFVARWKYFFNILSLVRIKILSRNKGKTINTMDLLIYNWRITWRILRRNKLTSLVNIVGLSIGFASVLLAWIYINSERKYDRFIADLESTVRISSHWQPRGFYAKTPFPVGPALVEEYSYVKDFFRCMKISTNDGSGVPIRIGERKYIEPELLAVDRAFLRMFNIQFVKGDPNTAFENPFSLVLTEQAANKYFGSEDPIGKVMKVEGVYDMQVVGVVKSINNESHLAFEVLAPMSFIMQGRWKNWDGFYNDWSSPMVWTYAQLENTESVELFKSDIEQFVQRRYPENFVDEDDNFYHYPQLVADIHLHSSIDREFKPNGNSKMLFVFGTVSLLVLLIAGINFINLTTARSSIRAKEVGVKKVVGAARSHLIRQFFFEVFVQNILALMIAYLLLLMIWQPFNQIMGVSIELENEIFLSIGAMSVLFIVLNTFISGTYPSIFLTSFKPIASLKGKVLTYGKGLNLRHVLVTLQFVAAMVFIACAQIISNQLNFIQTKDLGVNTSHLVVVNRPPQSVANDVILNAFKENANVISATATAGSLPGYSTPTWSFHPEGFPKERMSFNTVWSYADFVNVFGGKLLAGEDFDRKYIDDTLEAVILNESAIKKLGWTAEEAIGKSFDEFQWRQPVTNPGKVVGVVSDFNYKSLHHAVEPAVVLFTDNDFGNVILRLSGNDLVSTLQSLEDQWDTLVPEIPFTFRFMSDAIEQQYQKESRLGRSMDYFTTLALFITVLGLLGLLSFMLEQRTKEISIRKVLGADIVQIISLISRDFVKIICIAFLLAAAISYYLMQQWLLDFSFRVDVTVIPFIIAGMIAFLIIALLIGFKSMEILNINPAKTLKDE